MTEPLRWYLRLLAGLTIISCLGQLGLPRELGVAAAWGVAPGWQREIGFWNLAMYLAIALVTLQFLAATNHAAAAVQSHTILNAIMSTVNYGCVVFGVLALRVRAGSSVPRQCP